MGILQHLKDRFRPDRVTLQLDDIQALILRARPEPYVGIHAMLHVDDAAGGRDLLRRLAPHIPAAADWTEELTAARARTVIFFIVSLLGKRPRPQERYGRADRIPHARDRIQRTG